MRLRKAIYMVRADGAIADVSQVGESYNLIVGKLSIFPRLARFLVTVIRKLSFNGNVTRKAVFSLTARRVANFGMVV